MVHDKEQIYNLSSVELNKKVQITVYQVI